MFALNDLSCLQWNASWKNRDKKRVNSCITGVNMAHKLVLSIANRAYGVLKRTGANKVC